MGNARSRLRQERGAAAVEFALIAPLLFMLLFGIFQFGLVWSQKEIYVQAAREGARYAAVGCESSAGCGSDTPIRARVNEAALGYPITGTIQVTPSGGCRDNISDTVTVQWTQAFTIQIPFIPTMNVNAPIKAVFRCES